jgi:hypothetical protein
MISWMRISSQPPRGRTDTSGRTSFAKPGSTPDVKNDVAPAAHAASSRSTNLGEERLRVDERHDRARHDVLPRGEDAADVLDRLEGRRSAVAV